MATSSVVSLSSIAGAPIAKSGIKLATLPLAIGRYSEEKMPFRFMTKGDSLTSPYAYQRLAQTGVTWEFPISGIWGAYPYIYTIVSGPAELTIGQWLTRDSFGDWNINPDYGVLKWVSPIAGNHQIIVCVTEANGYSHNVSFTLNVGNNYYFAGLTASGSGDGSSYENKAAYTSLFMDGANHTIASPARYKVLCLDGGTYVYTGDFVINDLKPLAVINYPGTVPVIRSEGNGQIRLNTHHAFVSGIIAENWGPSSVFRTADKYHSQVVWRVEIKDAHGDPAGAFNEAGWFIDSTNNSTYKENFVFRDIIFRDCHEIAGFVWYSTKGLIDNLIWVTNKTVIKEPLWFPKGSCWVEVRHCRFDNDVVDFPDGDAVMLIYNSEVAAPAKAHVRYNFVRCKPNGRAAAFNTASNGATFDHAAETYDDHNTYAGGSIETRAHGGDMVIFENNIMQNTHSGVDPILPGFQYGDDNHRGTDGLIDANGRVIDQTKRGISGHQIYS